jgi:RHS repeat-associated protein
VSLPVTLYYSSKLWNIKNNHSGSCGEDFGTLYVTEYAKSSASGWTSNLDFFTWPEDVTREIYDPTTSQPAPIGDSNPNLHAIARFFLTLPDGSRHEMRKDDNFHPVTEGRSGLYYSVDGTRLIYDATGSVLYQPDGSRYTFAPAVTYTDRNGNTLSYDANAKQWTDTLGRALSLPLPSQSVVGNTTAPGREYDYSIPGVGNAPLTYHFVWKHLSEAGVISENEADKTLRTPGDHTTLCQTGSDNSGLFQSSDETDLGISKGSTFDPVVLYQIALPTGQSYTFKYDIYGEISKVIYPTGGYERFTYGVAPNLSGFLLDESGAMTAQANRGVTGAVVSTDGTAAGETLSGWVYDNFKVTAPDGSYTTRSVHLGPGQGGIAYGFEDPLVGRVYEECSYDASGRMLRRHLTDYAVDGQVVQYSGKAYEQRNVRPSKEVEILLDTAGGSALAATTTYSYDADLNPTITINTYYSYDAEDMMVSAGGSFYSYDCGGQRVKTLVGTTQTVFVYDAAGKVVAEYSNQLESNGTLYLTQDHLGSTRVVTDAQGSATSVNGGKGSRHDYLPFGEEAPTDGSWRTSALGYGAGDVRQKFTSQERDGETGLDYFRARYYSSAQGRFTGPDSVAGSASDPQTLNLYAYVRDNPLNFTDPTGHSPEGGGPVGIDGKASRKDIRDAEWEEESEREGREMIVELWAEGRGGDVSAWGLGYNDTTQGFGASQSSTEKDGNKVPRVLSVKINVLNPARGSDEVAEGGQFTVKVKYKSNIDPDGELGMQNVSLIGIIEDAAEPVNESVPKFIESDRKGTGEAFTYEKTFTYRAKNIVPGEETWRQTYSYDRYGNRRLDEQNTKKVNSAGTLAEAIDDTNRAAINPTVSPATNRVSQAGYSFDAAGNRLCAAGQCRFRELLATQPLRARTRMKRASLKFYATRPTRNVPPRV